MATKNTTSQDKTIGAPIKFIYSTIDTTNTEQLDKMFSKLKNESNSNIFVLFNSNSDQKLFTDIIIYDTINDCKGIFKATNDILNHLDTGDVNVLKPTNPVLETLEE